MPLINLDAISKICCSNIAATELAAIIPEPYIPYIPKKWNGILVLAEAQNLSNKNKAYVSRLARLPREERVARLYNQTLSPTGIGIQPWDDGSLKLAVISMFPRENPADFGVSNAVLWSVVLSTGANTTPTPELIARSADLWTKLLKELRPKRVICAGNKAAEVIGKYPNKITLRLPSPTQINRISGMFSEQDLLKRYPEVNQALARMPDIGKTYRANKIFYACHAVSKSKDVLGDIT